jgi:hypothetical protein
MVSHRPVEPTLLIVQVVSANPSGPPPTFRKLTEGSHRLVPTRSGGMAAELRLMMHGQFYFSISEAQFRKTESGAALASSTLVMIRNLCPSPLTS